MDATHNRPPSESTSCRSRLIVVGSGITAERLAELGGHLGYREIRLTDEPPADLLPEDHLVVAEDEPSLGRRRLLACARVPVLPAYLGYAAPDAEAVEGTVRLAAAGISEERLRRISLPAGAQAGAETPVEVAICAAAGLVAVRRNQPAPYLLPRS